MLPEDRRRLGRSSTALTAPATPRTMMIPTAPSEIYFTVSSNRSQPERWLEELPEPEAFSPERVRQMDHGLIRLRETVMREIDGRLRHDGLISLADYGVLITLVTAPGLNIAHERPRHSAHAHAERDHTHGRPSRETGSRSPGTRPGRRTRSLRRTHPARARGAAARAGRPPRHRARDTGDDRVGGAADLLAAGRGQHHRTAVISIAEPFLHAIVSMSTRSGGRA